MNDEMRDSLTDAGILEGICQRTEQQQQQQQQQLECIFLRPEFKLPLPFPTYFHFTSRFLFR